MGRRICIVTGTRAEYGLLYWLMREIADDKDLTLQIVATAMHLEPAFGHTVDQIRSDGFAVDAEVPMDLQRDDAVAIARATGRGVTGLADAFERLQPDIVVLLGDRFETLAAATAAALMRIPVAHIHGGEISEGAIDDAMRHAITKLSHLHFVAADEFRGRVIQMGEAPERVFTVGAPGLDHLVRRALPDRRADRGTYRACAGSADVSRDLPSGDPRRERSRDGSRRIARRARSISGCSHRFHQGQCRCRRTGDQRAARILMWRPIQIGPFWSLRSAATSTLPR